MYSAKCFNFQVAFFNFLVACSFACASQGHNFALFFKAAMLYMFYKVRVLHTRCRNRSHRHISFTQSHFRQTVRVLYWLQGASQSHRVLHLLFRHSLANCSHRCSVAFASWPHFSHGFTRLGSFAIASASQGCNCLKA